MSDQNCASCRFSLKVNGSEDRLWCRRYPPVLVAVGGDIYTTREDSLLGDICSSFDQPLVLTGDWCGEWQASPPAPPSPRGAAVTAGANCPWGCNWCDAKPCVITDDVPSDEHLCRCEACKREDDEDMARLCPPATPEGRGT